MIAYRTFRNTDPPALVDLWNDCFSGRGATALRGTMLLEYFTLAKPYFDPLSLVIATDGQQLVGFVHAGFGPSPAGTALDQQSGVICLLGVLPAFRRRGIGAELLRRAEIYLREHGARVIVAGPLTPLNPFTFGLYGGSDSPGFLESDALARPFFERHGYRVQQTALVLQRVLDTTLNVVDSRFAAHRLGFDIYANPVRSKSWWRECVLGPVELHEYRLQDKQTSATAARLTLWEMETFGPRWNEHALGLVELEVVPERRCQGLGKYLLMQVLKHLHEQFFTLLETQVRADNAPALNLLRQFNFRSVDQGHSFVRAQ